ncbi:hypothetical protein F2Q69_00010926 [Brassica cretica]|uniref:Retrotransposon gag domain-containing protein n=1 Tax=Brassica cretica TaxID=69181 RepID=A0A8S9QNB1_BRACR|nr:hypothetical protein F2Q69_00010926 [Brassica cretica]
MTIREYEVEFNRLRRFAGAGITEEDLSRKFLGGMRVEIRNRCRVVTYHRLGDLVEKAAEQEAGLAEEQKLAKSSQTKSGKTDESQRRTRTSRKHRIVLDVVVITAESVSSVLLTEGGDICQHIVG